MIIDDQIKNKKLQYDINREAAKISALLSDKIDKYEYLTGEEILPSNQQQIIEQVIEDQAQKQDKALEGLESKSRSIEGIFPEGYESVEIKNKLDKIKEYKKDVDRNNVIYYSSKKPFNFNAFKTIRYLDENIYSGKITINETDQEQADLLEHISNFNNKTRPKNKDGKKIKKTLLMPQKIFIRVEN